MEEQGPSIPSHYVTFLQLKERWLQQQSAKSTPQPPPDSASKIDATIHDSGSKIAKEAVPGRNRYRIVNQIKPDDDSGSKTPNEDVPVRRGTNRNRVVDQIKSEGAIHDSGSKTVADNQLIVEKQEHNNNQSNSKLSTKKKSSRVVTGQNQTGGSTPEHVQEKQPHRYDGRRRNRNQEVRERQPEPVQDNHSIVKKQVHNTDQSKFNISTKKNSSRNRNPRFLTGQNQTGGSTPEPELVPEKKQHRYNDSRRNRNQEVWEPKGKTEPLGQNVDDSSRNDSGGDGVVEAVAAAVKEMNLSRRTTGRYGSGSFNGGTNYRPAKPPIPAKIGQMSGVWVKKGESVPN